VVLKRDGVTYGTLAYPGQTGGFIAVHPDYAQYQLTATVQRTGTAVLSTSISAQWTFSSATVDPNSVLPLQLWAASFTPALTADNTARAGTGFTIPVTVAAQPGSAVSGVRTLTVDYWTDDGVTWQHATVTASGTGYTATVNHPNITGFVSLRAHVDDWAGNTADETIARAYRIAPGA
jgi:hypothetical protein